MKIYVLIGVYNTWDDSDVMTTHHQFVRAFSTLDAAKAHKAELEAANYEDELEIEEHNLHQHICVRVWRNN